MYLAPYGIFGSMAYTVGMYGLGMLLPLAKLIGSLYLTLIIFLAIVIAIAACFTKVNFYLLIRAIKEPLTLAFCTAAR